MELKEIPHFGGPVTIVLFDGDRMVAKASPLILTSSYLVIGYGVCLLDKKPSPTSTNDFGIADPQRIVCNLKEARRIMKNLHETG